MKIRCNRSIIAAIGAFALEITMLDVATDAQSPAPSPAPSAASGSVTTFDGRYAGTSTSAQGCGPGDFAITVSKGAITGSGSFKSTYRTQDHTYTYAASGTISGDGRAKAVFHTDDDAINVSRRDFAMSGEATADGITLSEGGQACGHRVTLTKS